MVNHRRDLVFSEEHTKTNKGEHFFMFDSEVEDRMSIFSMHKNLFVLASCKRFYMDGTFKSVRVIFEQLYTIQGIKNGCVIPLIYALLPNRREETSIQFLRNGKSVAPTLAVDSVNTDFEHAIVNTIKVEFSFTNHYGCHPTIWIFFISNKTRTSIE